jgi:hypothetical protein
MAAFQVVTPAKFCQLAIGTTLTLGYTVPNLTLAYLKDIDIPNTTGAAILVTVYIGNGAVSSNVLIPSVTIPAFSIFQWTGTQILNAGDMIQAVASALGCNLIASGATAV